MSRYRDGSNWNDTNELRCLYAYKKLEESNFSRGMQIDLARDLAKQTVLSIGSINAKIGNYKSVAGVTGHSNASKNTLDTYRKYGHLSSAQIQELLKKSSRMDLHE